MQYAPNDTFAPERPLRGVRRRILDEMEEPPAPAVAGALPASAMGPTGPRSGNTGVAGGTARTVTPPAAPIAPAAVPASGAQDALMRAVQDNLGTIRSAQGDAARKAAVESVLRGVNADGIEDIRGEKVKIGGKWIDLLMDVEGAAIPQWLVEDEQQASAAPASGGGLDPMQGSMRGMDSTQTSLIDQIRASIMQLMGQGVK